MSRPPNPTLLKHSFFAARVPDALLLKVTYTPTYPEEAPQVELETVEGDLADDELERLKNGLDSTAQDSLGMVSRFVRSKRVLY